MKQILLGALILLFMSVQSLQHSMAQTKSYLKQTIQSEKAHSYKTDLDFFAGELFVNATEEEAVAVCHYGYKADYIKPIMTYHEQGETGYASIQSESIRNKELDRLGKDNKWYLSLNGKQTHQLSVNLKAGTARLDLASSQLKHFAFRMMAGEAHVNLSNSSIPEINMQLMTGSAHLDVSGKWDNDLHATIKGGVGELNVLVPYETGVRITVSGLLGEINIPFFNRNGRTYTNDLYGKTASTLYIDINGGIGQINVNMVD